ncbi:MAG: hypothetical protein M4D80_19430 [Myxococcota bacterium]|nr:hypothetical protein [Myxococcota bacterium]
MWKRVGLICALMSSSALARPAASKLVVTQPIIEVLDPVGSVSVATVKVGLSKIERDLTKCGDDAKWSGEALVWLVTDWHGKVIKAEVAAEKSSVERCIAASLKRVVVPKAQSRATTMMRLRIAPADATP